LAKLSRCIGTLLACNGSAEDAVAEPACPLDFG
jgi:hypothetical protein